MRSSVFYVYFESQVDFGNSFLPSTALLFDFFFWSVWKVHILLLINRLFLFCLIQEALIKANVVKVLH